MTELISAILIGISLAMDAMAVSVTNGVRLKHCTLKDGVKMGVFFGVFQFLMPVSGYFLGCGTMSFVGVFAPYISAAILLFLGIRMVVCANKGEEDESSEEKNSLGFGELVLQAIATSIDAFAVGVSFAMSGEYQDGYIFFASAIIGIIAFGFSFVGAMAGRKIGTMFERWAETGGGIVLSLIGIRILLSSIIELL